MYDLQMYDVYIVICQSEKQEEEIAGSPVD